MSHQDARPEVLAIIPARGGSKGLPRKNILPLGGRPLIAWSIAAAQKASLVTRIIVSTDDEEIAAVAREWGVEVPFLRPAELAQDQSLAIQAVTHLLQNLKACEGYVPDAFCILYPTHPFRSPGLIDTLAAKALEGHSPAVTARRLNLGDQTHLIPTGDGYRFLKLADQPPAWRPYGLVEAKRPHGPTRGAYLHPIDDPVQCIDIDTPDDLLLAQAVVDEKLFAFPGSHS